MKAFFSLAVTTRLTKDALGFKTSGAIGEKGHGTKIYFNSRRIELRTSNSGQYIDAYMDDPHRKLRREEMPRVEYSTGKREPSNGTHIKIFGYNHNMQGGFGHDALRDYILWFTKFGSAELELGKDEFKDVVLHLKGLGHRFSDPERVSFGHPFPAENTAIANLKKSDNVAPLEFYVARWTFSNVAVDGKPGSTIDIVFSLEGDQAKRQYNKMLHEKWKAWGESEYNVEDRYGLWVCKDFIPIDRKNKWISERSEWTKYHAFVHSQDFRLTANRSNLDNTPASDLASIERTVSRVFRERIEVDQKFKKYTEELEKQHLYKNAEAEEKDFVRRKRAALSKKAAELEGLTLLEPRQEGGVFSLVMQLLAIKKGSLRILCSRLRYCFWL